VPRTVPSLGCVGAFAQCAAVAGVRSVSCFRCVLCVMHRILLCSLVIGAAAFGQRTPVVLVDGYHPICQSGDLTSGKTFGDLEARLTAEGVSVTFVGTCSYAGKPAIEDLGQALGGIISNLNAPQVDVITHSMGGLILRSYLSGKQTTSGVFAPPVDTKVRKWISIATPNFGALIPDIASNYLPDIEAQELVPGSQFLFDLATWNQNHDDLRGVDAVAIIGNAGGLGPLSGTSDGTVAVTSASLSFAEPDERTRILPYCHGTSIFNAILGLGCDAPPVARIQSDNPLSWQIIDSFLADTSDWRAVGHSPSQDAILSKYGGLLTQNRDAMDSPIGAISDETFAQGTTPGGYTVSIAKPGPQIALVIPAAARLPFLSLAPGMLISIYGTNLNGSAVAVDGQTLPQLYASDGLINARLPEHAPGLARLTVSSALGKAQVNIFFENAVPAVFTMNGSGSGPAAAYRIGDYVALYLTGLGTQGAVPTVLINGISANVTYAGPTHWFDGLDQINVELPQGVTTGTVIVIMGQHVSNTVTI